GENVTDAPILERRRHIAYVPQDRGRMGGSLPASVVENAIMTHHRLNDALVRWGGLLLDRASGAAFYRPSGRALRRPHAGLLSAAACAPAATSRR
ncbi:MAG: hypothetical protein IPM07_10795, partial [Anaerolineales bacterium]|nr:hypothetical protein [Anaerolineales bacterium]